MLRVAAPHRQDADEEGEGRHDHLPRLAGAELTVAPENLTTTTRESLEYIYTKTLLKLLLITGTCTCTDKINKKKYCVCYETDRIKKLGDARFVVPVLYQFTHSGTSSMPLLSWFKTIFIIFNHEIPVTINQHWSHI
jgi:hypothetical protein